MASVNTQQDMQDDLDYNGAVMCHVYYGRGFRLTNEEMLANILGAFNFAKAYGGDIMFVTDGEDVGFAPVNAPGDPEGRLLDRPEDSLGFDQPIENERMALLVYWENYGFASDDPEDWKFRDIVAEFVGIDPRHLQEPQ
jgi:hypothetical protein